MKKLACLLLVICITVSAFAKGTGRKYVASLDNDQVIKAKRDQGRAVSSFANGRRYSSVTRGSGIHLFGAKRSSGASNPESGLGL